MESSIEKMEAIANRCMARLDSEEAGRKEYIKLQKAEFNKLLKRYKDGTFYIFDDPELTEKDISERKEKYYPDLLKIRSSMNSILKELKENGVKISENLLGTGF